jgi:hypothetical protein
VSKKDHRKEFGAEADASVKTGTCDQDLDANSYIKEGFHTGNLNRGGGVVRSTCKGGCDQTIFTR